MHPAARNWISAHLYRDISYRRVIEVGSRNINGGVRDLIRAHEYVGIDLVDGPGVDLVCDARGYPGGASFDLVVCCEVLEHDPDPSGLIAALGWLARPDGTVLVTAAGIGREPHSAVDGGGLRDGEYYGNLDASYADVSWGRTVDFDLVDGDWRCEWRRYDH